MCFIVDCLCEFLTGDLRMMLSQLFTLNADLPDRHSDDEDMCKRVEALSYKIRHKYPDRLVTYDAEEVNETRLIRFSDLTQSVLDMVEESCGNEKIFRRSQSCENIRDCEKPKCCRGSKKCKKPKRCDDLKINLKSLFQNSNDCEKHQNCADNIECETRKVSPDKVECCNEEPCKEQKKSNCENPDESQDQRPRTCINICDSLKPFNTVNKLTRKQLTQLECCARTLHKLQAEGISLGEEPLCIPADWDCLSSMQKFSFYWQALTGHKLRRTPYDNFKDIFSRRYLKYFSTSNDVKQLRIAARRCWRRLKTDERVPFNLHALLYAVSVGEVDPCDHAAVRMLLSRWK